MNEQLPIKAQVLVYKRVEQNIFVLCLKRSQIDGGFWHILTGTMEMNETLTECIYRETKEEIGIDNILYLSKELNKHIWHKNNLPIWIIEYAMEISNSDKIILNNEHSEFKWLKQNDALMLLEKDSAKKLLNLSFDHINKNV